eukprot:gene41001-55410_t
MWAGVSKSGRAGAKDRAPALLARAARYGQSRIVCGQHFRSDVSAGQLLGGLIVERLMTKAEFQAAFAEARSELVAAGIVRLPPRRFLGGAKMIRLMLTVMAALLCVGTAHADDALHVGAAPAWVTPLSAPVGKPADGAVTARLIDCQVRFDERGTHTFYRQITRINAPEGLLAMGNVGLAWQPAFGGVTVHRVTIHRGTQAIDILGDGKGFQILRREAGLESLMITGVLTAILQVPDLHVGDELEVSYTIDEANPVLGGHIEVSAPLTKMPSSTGLASSI